MMYSLSNNSISINPITQTEFSFEPGAKVVKPLANNESCFISKLEDPYFSLFHIPSPFMPYEYEALFFQEPHNLELQQQENSTVGVSDATKNLSQDDPSKNKSALDDPKECNSTVEQIRKKKITKKDRHSKINTAHGPRDRRMRLSLDVARKFFDLQDLLRFDKASKTVDWLLTKSRSAIEELLGANSASSTSECEVISGFDESAMNENQQGQVKINSCTKEKKKVKVPRRIAYHSLAKESRDKARERARERTREKKRLGEANKLHIYEESGGTQDYCMKNHNPCNGSIHESSHLAVVAGENFVNDSSMAVCGIWSPSAPFSFQLSAGMCTTGPQHGDSQHGDFQFYSK